MEPELKQLMTLTHHARISLRELAWLGNEGTFYMAHQGQENLHWSILLIEDIDCSTKVSHDCAKDQNDQEDKDDKQPSRGSSKDPGVVHKPSE
ncbi:hypothetical protein DITRI_Ditri17bG0027100 [Diplodiscus trichospermus]